MRQLNEKERIHNDGSALWDYLFESQPLPKTFSDYELSSKDGDWFDEGVSWLMDELLDGEVFEHFENDDKYVYTSMGRHINIKKKKYRALTMQGNSIAGNSDGGAFSMTKMVRERWGIELDYRTLPYECSKHIVTSNASKDLRQWIEENE